MHNMLFHQYGYESAEPRVKPAAGYGVNREDELPEKMDVLIVGSGPAGATAHAMLAAYPNVSTRMVERRDGRLIRGHADGIQSRSVETFDYFDFAERIMKEAFWIREIHFWRPDPDAPENIIKTDSNLDDAGDVSEFPHVIANQARVLDYLNEFAENSPSRMKPNWGYKFISQETNLDEEYPIAVTLEHTAGEHEGERRVVHTKYLIGADGAHSAVRKSIGRVPIGDKANHAWGVMDVLVKTDFPDIRTKSAIQSNDGGSIILIPREGGFLVRFYVDLGEVPEDDAGAVRNTSVEEITAAANAILHPYTIEVKKVAWSSVYEVGHRVTDKFDDVDNGDEANRNPHVFILGDACHTHSAKAGQGMNVSIQDGLNLAWKLGQVISGYSDPSLLHSYSDERQEIAQRLVDFDREWANLVVTKPEDLPDPNYLSDYYAKTAEFQAGFLTEYKPSVLTTDNTHQDLATGFPLGKRFKSALAQRVADTNHLHIGHTHKADGRWRIYAFADAALSSDTSSKVAAFGRWLGEDANSPVVKFTPSDEDPNYIFDAKVIYQQPCEEVALMETPEIFRPESGAFGVPDLNNVWASIEGNSIFDARGVSTDGAVVIVRPDGYVSGIFPLDATDDVAGYFDNIFSEQD